MSTEPRSRWPRRIGTALGLFALFVSAFRFAFWLASRPVIYPISEATIARETPASLRNSFTEAPRSQNAYYDLIEASRIAPESINSSNHNQPYDLVQRLKKARNVLRRGMGKPYLQFPRAKEWSETYSSVLEHCEEILGYFADDLSYQKDRKGFNESLLEMIRFTKFAARADAPLNISRTLTRNVNLLAIKARDPLVERSTLMTLLEGYDQLTPTSEAFAHSVARSYNEFCLAALRDLQTGKRAFPYDLAPYSDFAIGVERPINKTPYGNLDCLATLRLVRKLDLDLQREGFLLATVPDALRKEVNGATSQLVPNYQYGFLSQRVVQTVSRRLPNSVGYQVIEGSPEFNQPYILQGANEATQRASLAIRIYRMDHKGAFPGRLTDLVDAGIVRKLPEDPYRPGHAVCYLPGDKVYSVGPNGVDDGGTRGGASPTGGVSGDVSVVRLTEK